MSSPLPFGRVLILSLVKIKVLDSPLIFKDSLNLDTNAI